MRDFMFEDNLKKLRKVNNITQAELAQQMNVSLTTVSNWETGFSKPDVEQLKRLAEIFNVSTDYLLGINYNKQWKDVLVKAGILNSNDEISYDELKNTIYLYKEYKEAIKKSTNNSTN